MQPKSTGQAVSKDERYIYTWYDDGSVIRCRVYQNNGLVCPGPDEQVKPAPTHNLNDFHAFVPVEAPFSIPRPLRNSDGTDITE